MTMKRSDLQQAINIDNDIGRREAELRNAKAAIDRLPKEIEELKAKLAALGVTE